MRYARYTERNDNEGETWHRWIPENDPKLGMLKEYLESIDFAAEGFGDDTYELEVGEDGELFFYNEEYVNVTLEETDYVDGGYFDTYRITSIVDVFTLDWLKLDPAEALYKLAHLVGN